MDEHLTFFELIRRCLLWDRANTRLPLDLTDTVLSRGSQCRNKGTAAALTGDKGAVEAAKKRPPPAERKGRA